jgi:hypothetical protein
MVLTAGNLHHSGARMSQVAPAKGRFRSFLLASVNHFLADQRDKTRVQGRGGGNVISLHAQEAETWLAEPAAEGMTPEKAFERRWAITLLEQVYGRLGQEYREQGKGRLG